MFWSDVETDTIVMSDLTGSNSRVLIGTGLTTVGELRHLSYTIPSLDV